jgi:hypothetical protein
MAEIDTWGEEKSVLNDPNVWKYCIIPFSIIG